MMVRAEGAENFSFTCRLPIAKRRVASAASFLSGSTSRPASSRWNSAHGPCHRMMFFCPAISGVTERAISLWSGGAGHATEEGVAGP